MLNYLKKFAVDIFPSVAATVIGAYIVNHYIVARPTADTPPAAAASTANPKVDGKAEAKSASKPAETTASVSNLPAPGVKAKGVVRSQWPHVIDVCPTVLQAAGLRPPPSVN